MTVPIIIEGPDESGKTTLALALLGYFHPEAGILKSPASRSPEWSSYFDSWVGKVTSDANEAILILDRVPEISELVYGPIMREKSRLNSPVASILNLPKEAVIILCHPKPGPLKGTHFAGGAQLLRTEDQGAIIGGYEVVGALVQEFTQTIHWYYWNYHWNALLSKLPVRLPNVNVTFEDSLKRGTEMVRDLPREAF